MQKGGSAVVRQRRLIAVVVVFVIAVVMAGCGGGPGNIEGPDSQRGAVTTNEETTPPEGDRPTAETAQEPAALDAKVVSPGQAYVPAGFGEGSLWTTVSDPSADC